MDLWEYETYYGYFYVKNGHVQAMHILDPAQEKTSKVLTGTVSAVNGSDPTTINIKNVSQWDNGGWIEGSAVEINEKKTESTEDESNAGTFEGEFWDDD